MKKLGIIGAMAVEVETLKSEMENLTVVRKAGMEFYDGLLEGFPVVVVQCGVGKVNAAMCAQVLCDCFEVTHLVNTGIAGSLCADLDIGDLVVSKDAMYHDFDCVHFGYEMGKVPGMDVTAFPADEAMIGYACAAAEAVNPGHSKVGRVASGDLFVAEKSAKNRIIERTNAICTEMEGAAIAHTAADNGIPCLILRTVSDLAEGDASVSFDELERYVGQLAGDITVALLANL